MITGFRVARGGAQERYGVTPDLTILGKIVGGGLPLAAFGGRADVMDRLAPRGDVYQAGTLSGNPLATAAGLAVLRRLRDDRTCTTSSRSRSRAARGGPGARTERLQRVGAMATLFMNDGPVRNFDDAQASDTERYGALFRHLLASGVYVAPSQFECMFVSLAHGDEEIERTIAGRCRLRRLTSGTRSPARRAARASCGPRRCARARTRSASRCSRRSARSATRSGSRRSTRATCSTTARSRLFAPEDGDTALLLGDYLYAHGLVRIEQAGTVEAVNDLAELIALCARTCAPREIGRRRRGLGRDRRPCSAAARSTRGARRCGSTTTQRPLERLARAQAGDAAVDAAFAAHRARLR